MSRSSKNKRLKDWEKIGTDFKLISIEENPDTIELVLVPDDRYWEKKTVDGKIGYYNRLTKTFVSSEELIKKFDKYVGKEVKITLVPREKVLGTSTTIGIKKLVEAQKFWEALFSLHVMHHHQLQTLLFYKFRKRDEKGQFIDDGFDKTRLKLIQENLRYYRETVDICFAAQIIDNVLRDKLINFNQTRDKLTHKLIHEQISVKDLEEVCKLGLELLEKLEIIWEKMFI